MQDPPLEMLPTQDKTHITQSTQTQKLTQAVFLFYSNSMSQYIRQDTLFIGMSGLVGKMGKGKMGKEGGATKGVDHGQNCPFARSSRR